MLSIQLTAFMQVSSRVGWDLVGNFHPNFNHPWKYFITTCWQEKVGFLANGWTHPLSMTTFVHLFIRSILRKVTIVTLNTFGHLRQNSGIQIYWCHRFGYLKSISSGWEPILMICDPCSERLRLESFKVGVIYIAGAWVHTLKYTHSFELFANVCEGDTYYPIS